MAINAGVNVSKLVGYAVLAPMPGVDVTKLVAYAVLTSANVTPPIWPDLSFPDGQVGVAYSQAWDMPTSALTVSYSVPSGALPDSLSLSALAGNAAKISGTPTVDGTFDFVLRATNTYGTVDKAFSITIAAASALLVVPLAEVLHDGTIGVAYSETLSAQGGTGPYSYSVTSGALPDGTSLSGDTISGTPTVADTFTFTIKATDSDGNFGSQEFSITVSEPSAGGGGGAFTFLG